MNFVSGILIASICVGFALIIFSLFNKKDKIEDTDNFYDIEAINELVNKLMEDADLAVNQINDLANDIFQEFEEKYQQMLFLYQLIDDKIQSMESKVDKEVDNSYESSFDYNYSNPKLNEIKEMYQKGMSISEISKTLDMGQGEVKLIMELGKMR